MQKVTSPRTTLVFFPQGKEAGTTPNSPATAGQTVAEPSKVLGGTDFYSRHAPEQILSYFVNHDCLTTKIGLSYTMRAAWILEQERSGKGRGVLGF